MISYTSNEDDVILGPCIQGERVIMTRSREVSDEYFYFYIGVIEYFKIWISFTNFEFDLLTILNIAPLNFTLIIGVL